MQIIPSKKIEYLPYILLLLLFAIYLSSISPVVYVGDSGELAAASFSLGIPHNSGYPLYAIIGKIFCLLPFGNIGFRMNLMSAFFSVLTVGITYAIIFRITSSKAPALIGAFILAFIPLLWSQTVSAEVYTLHTFFVALLILILLLWDEKREFRILILLAFLTGISFCNHLQTLMLAPAFLYLILSGDIKSLLNNRKIIWLSLFFIFAFLVYLYLPIRTIAGAAIHWGDPDNLERFLDHVSGKSHRSSYVFTKSVSEYMTRLKEVFLSMSSQFGFILLLSIWGWLKTESIRWRIFYVLIILFDTVYTVFLNIISLEITAFNLPSSIVFSILAGIGVASIFKMLNGLQGVSGNIKYFLKTCMCLIPLFPLVFNYKFCDQSRNYTAYEHAVSIFRTLDTGNTLIMDGDNNIFPLTYGRIVERMREDVVLYDRYNLFFKMPYMDGDTGTFTYYGKWLELRDMLEKKIIETKGNSGVFYSGFNLTSVSVPEGYRMVPFGVLDQIIGNETELNIKQALGIWSYYPSESFYDAFQRDYMTREITSYFYFKRGKSLIMSGNYDDGLKFLKAASETGYNDEMIHSDMALFLSDHGFFKEAKEALEKALIYHQDLSGIYNNWGYYYDKLGDSDKAIESFQKAIELNPGNYNYYNNLALSLYNIDEKNESLKIFQKSLSIHKDQPRILKLIENNFSDVKI